MTLAGNSYLELYTGLEERYWKKGDFVSQMVIFISLTTYTSRKNCGPGRLHYLSWATLFLYQEPNPTRFIIGFVPLFPLKWNIGTLNLSLCLEPLHFSDSYSYFLNSCMFPEMVVSKNEFPWLGVLVCWIKGFLFHLSFSLCHIVFIF